MLKGLKKENPNLTQREKWLNELNSAKVLLDLNEKAFNVVDSMGATEYIIYEYNALQSLYRSILRQIREYDSNMSKAKDDEITQKTVLN